MTGRLQTIATHLLCLRPSPIARTHEPPSGGAPAGVAAAPQVCSEAGEALRLLRRDGAVVFQAFRDPAHQLTEATILLTQITCINYSIAGVIFDQKT